MTAIAKFIRVMKEWKAPALLFYVDPLLNNHDLIIITAANAIDSYAMIVYLVNDIMKHEWYAFCETEPFRSNLPDFRGILKQLGYKMVGDIPRKPREIIRRPR